MLVMIGVTNGPSELQTVQLLTDQGDTVATYQGVDHAIWVDDQTFVLYHYERVPATPAASGVWQVLRDEFGNEVSTVSSARVESLDTSVVDLGHGVGLSNAHGAVASSWLEFDNGRPSGRFTVWSAGVRTSEQDGYPVAWSPGGDKLALLHLTESGRGVEGSLEVLSWPDLAAVFTDANAEISDEVELWLAFDAPGDRIAYFDGPRLKIADLNSATAVEWDQPSPWGHIAWDAQDRLVVADFDEALVAGYDSAGNELLRWPGEGRVVVSTPSGEPVAYYDNLDDFPVVHVIRDGTTDELVLPGQLAGRIHLSPAGEYMVAVCFIRDVPTVVLRRL